MLKIPDFLNFPKSQNGRKWPELADNYSKTSALPQSLSKFFFVSQTQKFMKIFQKNHPPPQKGHFGGGVMILNVVFARFDAACLHRLISVVGKSPCEIPSNLPTKETQESEL